MKTRDVFAIVCIIMAFALGWASKPDVAQESIVERVDTLWQMVHDTTFVSVERKVERLDTVLLARVDTLLSTDSVLVEVPIEEQTWTAERYQITTEGYRVALKEVYINIPTIEREVTKTIVKRKHWNWGVGAQAGYGITIGGPSPYVGVGVSFGYTF